MVAVVIITKMAVVLITKMVVVVGAIKRLAVIVVVPIIVG